MIQPNNYRIDEAKYKSLLKYIRLSVTEKYEFPQEIVQIDGVTIATIGNFSASTGKPKSKKTFNVSAIVASALSGKEVLKYKAELPSCKIEFYTSTQNKASAIATKCFIESSNLQDCLLTRKMTTSNSWFCVNTLLTKGEILYDGHSTKSKTSGS